MYQIGPLVLEKRLQLLFLFIHRIGDRLGDLKYRSWRSGEKDWQRCFMCKLLPHSWHVAVKSKGEVKRVPHDYVSCEPLRWSTNWMKFSSLVTEVKIPFILAFIAGPSFLYIEESVDTKLHLHDDWWKGWELIYFGFIGICMTEDLRWHTRELWCKCDCDFYFILFIYFF